MSRFASLFTGQAENKPDAPPPPPPKAQAPYAVLLVDDEPNVLKSLLRVFRQENYDIHTASNGQEALDLIASRPFNVMISDYQMPIMDGATLLKEAKKTKPDMIRIMLTGNADTGAVMGAIKEGAVYKFILKPWNDDDLRVTVALALEQWELSRRNSALQQENIKKAKEISALSKLSASNRSQLAIVLRKRGALNDAQVQELYRLQQARKEPLIRLLLDKGWVDEKTIFSILSKDLLLESVDLAQFQIEPALTALVPKSFCERQWVLPLKLDGRRLLMAMADPLDEGLIDDMRFVSGLEIQPVLSQPSLIRNQLKGIFGDNDEVDFRDMETITGSVDPYESIEIIIDEEESEENKLENLLRSTEEPPAIRLVNAIILEAVRLGASDVHVQPRTKSVVVRYRIDGILMDKIHIPHQIHQSFVSRLKIMAELDISERRRPQDGRITVKTPNRIVDLRISTLPTINGEKIVMRLLDRNASIVSLQQLGFNPQDFESVTNLCDKPKGIILATGPTGSGKTTTLYSLLQNNASPSKNYVTIEDPVEYYMDMAGQVLIKERIGLTFPVVLRSILRQDPDVIMLGEIRDLETAEVAFHAALTGHLVYSTLHTNSSVATIARVMDLGLKPFVVATALEGIIAQRLVRKCCDHCRAPVNPDKALASRLGTLFNEIPLKNSFLGAGCPRCNGSGYKGRAGLYEVLIPDEEFRDLISENAGIRALMTQARKNGFRTLIEDARDKVESGLTSLEEVFRVLGPQ